MDHQSTTEGIKVDRPRMVSKGTTRTTEETVMALDSKQEMAGGTMGTERTNRIIRTDRTTRMEDRTDRTTKMDKGGIMVITEGTTIPGFRTEEIRTGIMVETGIKATLEMVTKETSRTDTGMEETKRTDRRTTS
jgi:hypothetical protein